MQDETEGQFNPHDIIARSLYTSKHHSLKKITEQISIFIILIVSSSCSFSQKNLNTQSDAFNFQIIKNIQLISMHDSLVKKNMSVVLHKDTIKWVGNTNELPEYTNSNIIDGNNNFLMPGLSLPPTCLRLIYFQLIPLPFMRHQ